MRRKNAGQRKESERRRAPRAMARIPVEFKRDKGVIEARTMNISSSGAYCTLDKFIPLNTKLGITLLIPGKDKKSGKKLKRVTCHGIVVRNEPECLGTGETKYGVGLFFTDLGAEDRREISNYVKEKLPSRERAKLVKGTPQSGGYDPGEVFLRDIPGREGLSVSSANFRILGDDINLSSNGIYCQIDRSIPLFREIAVNLVFPSNGGGKRGFKAVQCSGVVVGCEKTRRSKKYDLAVYFVGLSKKDKDRIAKYTRKPSE